MKTWVKELLLAFLAINLLAIVGMGVRWLLNAESTMAVIAGFNIVGFSVIAIGYMAVRWFRIANAAIEGRIANNNKENKQ